MAGVIPLIQIQGERRMIIAPASIANAKLVYPIPASSKR